MMVSMEVHAEEGGVDAALFAEQFASAVAKHSKRGMTFAAGKWVLHRL